jgi:PAS domain S-box-containing protein
MQNGQSAILIVDDKPANILALESLLVSGERNILTATNGRDALKIVLNKDVDLVILDVQMPEMDGFEVASILKSNKRTRDIPIIFASAERKEYQFMIKGYEEGAVDYLFKPLDPDIAKAKVDVLLRIQRQKKELVEKNKSLETSALLINNSADIIGIIDAESLLIGEINHAFTRTLGYSTEEAKQINLQDIVAPEYKPRLLELRSENREALSFETYVFCKDGQRKWLQWNVIVKEGKWFVNARDITEIKSAEKIRNYLATVVRQSNDAIYIHNLDGQIISWNKSAERMHGYTEEQALNMQVWAIIPEELHEEIRGIISRLVAGEKIRPLETRRLTNTGDQVDVLFSAALIADPENGQVSISISEQDITLKKIADEKIRQLNKDLHENIAELENSNKELDSFSYSVSHDLRAPLRILNGYASIIEEDYSDSLQEEAKRMFANIKKNAQKMSTLIDDLLAFSKIGKKEVKKYLVNMDDMVAGVISEINKSTKHQATITINPLPSVLADFGLLQQVWVNLVSNGIKYSANKPEPRVEIGAISKGHEVTYYVKDNGAGFNMQYASKLFGVFQRLHGVDEFEGTGIGLAIVQRVINKHKGKVWAEAKVNEGACFYFTLPA